MRLLLPNSASLVHYCYGFCIFTWTLFASPAWGQANLTGSTAPMTALAARALPNDAKTEAAWRFDRGLELYNQRDYEGALVEFERAYALTHNASVLFNVGLVQAKLGDSVSCLQSLEPLLKSHRDELGPERLDRALRVVNEHRPNVGSLEVVTNVAAPVVQINNIEVKAVGAIPLGAGKHVVSVFAPDYEPRRVAVTVVGQAKQRIEIVLSPTQQLLAHLAIDTSTPDVQVFAGDEWVATTPLAASLSFKPGVQELHFRRLGYKEELRTVVLHPGSSGRLDVRLTATAHGSNTGRLKISANDANAVVWVDGEPRPDFARGMVLPLGRHQIRVQRYGYHDLLREVVVETTPSELSVELFPTTATLTEYERRAQAGRSWSWALLGGGAAVLSGSALFLLWNQGEKNAAQRAFEEQTLVAGSGPSGKCSSTSCEESLVRLGADLTNKRDRDVFGWVSASLGVAGLTTGVLLRILGDDPDAFRKGKERLFAGSVAIGALDGGVVLSGSF